MNFEENSKENDISISQKLSENIQIISMSGKLIYQNIPLAREKVNSIFGEYQGYILDFSHISKIDSTGFGLIFNIIKRKPKDSKIAAIVSDPFIWELFKITKIDQLLSIYDSADHAMDSFK